MQKLFAIVLAFCLGVSQCLATSITLTGAGVQAAAGGGFSLTFGSSGSSTALTATISYGTLTWGSGCNAVVLGIQWYNVNTTDVVSSVSIGGSAASQVTGVKVTPGNGQVTADMWELVSPSGTSGTVSVTYSVAPGFSSAVAIYCLVSAHTTDTASTNASAFSTSVNKSITVPSSGTALALSGAQSGSTITFTNATLDAAPVLSGAYFAFGHTTATGAVSVTGTVSSSQGLTLGLAAWGP